MNATHNRGGDGRGYRTFQRAEWEILVGKGAADNDALTFRVAARGDLWMHVSGWSGSHVVIRIPDGAEDPPREVVEYAARLAAWYSKGRGAKGKIEVHVCRNRVSRRAADPAPFGRPRLIKMIDTHCHLTHPRLTAETDDVVIRAREAGLRACVTIGTGVEDARQGAALARRHPGFVFRAAGIDPFTAHALGDRFDEELEVLRGEYHDPSCVAVGEIGLDYHYDLDARPSQTRKLERQLDLALDLDLPVVIHVREAHDDMASILAAHPRNRGVIHSFTAGPREAETYLDMGWRLAFNGVLTFKNASEVREAARMTPENRLLLETDSPYLAPVPLRGKRCEPAHVVHTLAVLADVRGVEPERMAQATSRNAAGLFGFEASEPL